MAISLMIQKASPSVLPLAFRAVSSARPLHGSIFTAMNVVDHALASGDSSLQSHHYSTVAVAKNLLDNMLLKVLRSEIKSAKKSEFERKVPPSPSSFPFAIKDNPGERTITLTREFRGETIEVKVEMPPLQDLEETESEDSGDDSSDDEENDSVHAKDNEHEGNNSDSGSRDKDSDDDVSDSDETDDDSSLQEDNDDGEEKQAAPSIPMIVTVSKADGRRLTFEILASAEEIYVENMSIKESSNSESKSQLVEHSGPDFQQLDPDVQRSLYKYLEIRGIKLSTAVFLHKYMVNKSRREDLLWMRKLRNFVKEAKSN